MLSCHVQNFIAITWLKLWWEQNVISIEFEIRQEKHVMKRVPGHSPSTHHQWVNDPISRDLITSLSDTENFVAPLEFLFSQGNQAHAVVEAIDEELLDHKELMIDPPILLIIAECPICYFPLPHRVDSMPRSSFVFTPKSFSMLLSRSFLAMVILAVIQARRSVYVSY